MVLINYTLLLRPLSPFGKSEALLTGVSLQSSLAYRSIAHPPCLSQYCSLALPISSWVEQIHHYHGALRHGFSASPFLASKRPHVGQHISLLEIDILIFLLRLFLLACRRTTSLLGCGRMFLLGGAAGPLRVN